MILTGNTRLRLGLFGRLILQVELGSRVWNDHTKWNENRLEWRDASVAHLTMLEKPPTYNQTDKSGCGCGGAH